MPRTLMPRMQRGRKDLFTDEGNSFGVGVNGLAKAFQPLRCVHYVADNRVVDLVRRADIADNDQAYECPYEALRAYSTRSRLMPTA
jgi:hypothetical protein